MKNLTIEQLAKKYNTCKSDRTKDKVSNFVCDFFGKDDNIKFANLLVSTYDFSNSSDSMVR